jgi:amidophosphoribosyltransferase
MDCGIIGIFSKDNVVDELIAGLKLLQHRGQSAAGILTVDNGNMFFVKNAGLVSNLLREEEMKNYPGSIGIGHTRYSTAGGDAPDELRHNAQPEYVISPFLAVAFNGNIYNMSEVMKNVSRKPRTDCDVQCLLLPLAEELQNKKINVETISNAVEKLMYKLKGSYSAIFVTIGNDKPYMFAMTDPYKIRPLILGKKVVDGKTSWYLASESRVIKKLDAEYVMDVPGGSVLIIDMELGVPLIKTFFNNKHHHCMFEWIYFSKPDSEIEKRSVHDVRVEIGKQLARNFPVDADAVVPIPESGRRYAVGYSKESGIPIEEGLMKDEHIRTFILQTQQKRSESAKSNISAVEPAVKGKRIVVTDDSLIRGTNIRSIIQKLRDAGAKEIHVRIGCPPVVAPCYLGIDMRSKKEFIAVDGNCVPKDWEVIAKEIGADSLAYGSIDIIKNVITKSNGFNICTGCLDFPNGYPPDMRDDVSELIKKDVSGKRAYENQG